MEVQSKSAITICVHDYKFSPEASDHTRVVTICSGCGDAQVKLTLANIDQMDLWTQPPHTWLHDRPSNIMDRRLN